MSCKAPKNGLLDRALYQCFIIIIMIYYCHCVAMCACALIVIFDNAAWYCFGGFDVKLTLNC